MVVHDCFSGGGVPQHMFTMEFWDDLKSVIHEDGVVAVVSYACDVPRGILIHPFTRTSLGNQIRMPRSPSSSHSRRVLVNVVHSTTHPKPPRNNRILSTWLVHSSTRVTETSLLLAQVIFCTCSSQPLTFRPSRDADYLNSYLRRHILSTLPKREVYIGAQKASGERDIDKFILTDNHNPLNKWLEKLAFSHWKRKQIQSFCGDVCIFMAS
jgi:hypothetical protein